MKLRKFITKWTFIASEFPREIPGHLVDAYKHISHKAEKSKTVEKIKQNPKKSIIAGVTLAAFLAAATVTTVDYIDYRQKINYLTRLKEHNTNDATYQEWKTKIPTLEISTFLTCIDYNEDQIYVQFALERQFSQEQLRTFLEKGGDLGMALLKKNKEGERSTIEEIIKDQDLYFPKK